LRLWRAVKQFDDSAEDEDIEQLLRDCDLEKKIHSNANNLSGGQKRKLQLAIGLIGGSKSGFLEYFIAKRQLILFWL
jgi:ABC-type multidrug transport system ATPase subunit